MNAFEIIKTVRLTEKGTAQSEKFNQYTVVADRRANKIQIRQAVQELFKVKVIEVNTMNVRGKYRQERAMSNMLALVRAQRVTGSRHMSHTGGPSGGSGSSRVTANPWRSYSRLLPSLEDSRYAGRPSRSHRSSTEWSRIEPIPLLWCSGSVPSTAR